MSGYNNGVRTFVAGGAISQGARVKLDTATNTVVVNTSGAVGIGFAERTVASGAAVSVRIDAPTSQGIASAAILTNVVVYAAAAGKLAPTGTVAVGVSLEAAAADGDLFEVLPVDLLS